MPLGHPATAGACSCGSRQRWSPVTRRPAPFLRIPETSGGHPGSSPQLQVTPEETRAPTCQPQAQPLLCNRPQNGSPCGLARGPRTAGTAPTGAAPMATRLLWGRSGKAAPGPLVSRAGMSAALTGCLWPRGPIKLAAQSLTATTGGGRGREQWPPQCPRPTSPRPSRVSPLSAGAPSLAVAMTTWPQQQALLGKAVWASPATHTPWGACCPAPSAPAQTGPPAGTSLPLWAGVTASGTVAATATPTTLPRRRSA